MSVQEVEANIVPNKETISAMLEAEQIAKDPSVKGYTDLDELFADLNTKTLEAIQNVEVGKNLSKKFKSVKELMNELNG